MPPVGFFLGIGAPGFPLTPIAGTFLVLVNLLTKEYGFGTAADLQEHRAALVRTDPPSFREPGTDRNIQCDPGRTTGGG